MIRISADSTVVDSNADGYTILVVFKALLLFMNIKRRFRKKCWGCAAVKDCLVQSTYKNFAQLKQTYEYIWQFLFCSLVIKHLRTPPKREGVSNPKQLIETYQNL